MENPLISVIVPAYNIAPYLDKSIASICAQSYGNLEIVIVDDGSSDDTLSVARGLAEQDRRIRVIAKENGGVTSARLRGAVEAAGEWIGFMDGDDYIEPQMYERLLANAQKYDADISHCGYQMVFPKGHVDYYYNTGRLLQQDRKAGLMALLEGSYIEPCLCSKLFHRSLFHHLLRNGTMDTTIRNTEDLLMNYYLFREAKQSVYEDICPYHYVLRASSAATTVYSSHKLKDPMKVTRILLHETNGEAAEIQAIAQQKYVRQLISNATADCGGQPEEAAAFRREMRSELRSVLGKTLRNRDCSVKLKLMALWAGLLPGSYGWVHRMYAKIRGFDNIYSLDK